jgi:hypothetical protein
LWGEARASAVASARQSRQLGLGRAQRALQLAVIATGQAAKPGVNARLGCRSASVIEHDTDPGIATNVQAVALGAQGDRQIYENVRK